MRRALWVTGRLSIAVLQRVRIGDSGVLPREGLEDDSAEVSRFRGGSLGEVEPGLMDVLGRGEAQPDVGLLGPVVARVASSWF